MYCTALEKAIDAVKKQGREPHVLDIGTGTGLLAMMAAKAGATRVTACEVSTCTNSQVTVAMLLKIHLLYVR